MEQQRIPENLIMGFFPKLETIPFLEDVFAQHIPDLVSTWDAIGRTQSVSWPWVMMQELVLTAFCTHTAVLNPENSIDVCSLTWTFLLHPGATQSSGLTRMYAYVWDELDISLNRDILARHQEAVERASHVPDAPKPRKPLPVSSTLSSGSIEGVGLQASEPQNMGVACGFLAEGSKFLEWLKHESGDNKSICTELHERFKWKRQTINSARSFDIYYPHIDC